jgi:transcriptional regulator GlxA family with amidase domain
MDLALALVDEDHGPALALEIARRLVLFVRRPGGQAQFSVQLAAAAERRPVRAAQQLIAEHLADDLTVESMARQVGMSPRNFARRFREELGVTPARYVERARVEAARHLLETTAHDVPTVAVAAGFGSPETMHRAFQRALRVMPGQYRRHFTKEAS